MNDWTVACAKPWKWSSCLIWSWNYTSPSSSTQVIIASDHRSSNSSGWDWYTTGYFSGISSALQHPCVLLARDGTTILVQPLFFWFVLCSEDPIAQGLQAVGKVWRLTWADVRALRVVTLQTNYVKIKIYRRICKIPKTILKIFYRYVCSSGVDFVESLTKAIGISS